MIEVPCKNCESREVGCHSKCEKYLKYREEWQKANKKIREDKKAFDAITSYQVERVRRLKYRKKS